MAWLWRTSSERARSREAMTRHGSHGGRNPSGYVRCDRVGAYVNARLSRVYTTLYDALAYIYCTHRLASRARTDECAFGHYIYYCSPLRGNLKERPPPPGLLAADAGTARAVIREF